MSASTPEQIHRLVEAFNAGDLDGLMELYEPDAALIAQPGSVAYGIEQARAALQGFLALKGRITLDAKLVVTVADLAYLSNAWSLRGTGPDGNSVVLGATTAEVARRQADGSWRYGVCCVVSSRGVVEASATLRFQMARVSSSNATASRRATGSSTASS
jgi:uncharacterized protein (TIGR02246 family)